jgi:hypothetical protein
VHSQQIADLFQVQDRFLRSVHLERDFSDPKALKGYVVTPQTKLYVERLASGLQHSSGQRAWRITGDYGSGKSSFALFLAQLFSEQHARLPEHLRRIINFKQLGVPRPRLLPVLVTGSHQPLAVALLQSLQRDLMGTCGRGRTPGIVDRIESKLNDESGEIPSDGVAVDLLQQASAHIVATGKGSGILLLLDELGKFLEYGALHPERQDVFLLQKLAEAAARSKETPLFIIGLLHQGFNAYAEHLSQPAQREWEKVAGRFDEVLFNQPLEHTAILIADALNIRTGELHKSIVQQARHEMDAMLNIGWYGPAFTRSNLIGASARMYPLHPSVIPVLVKLFSRFGQNERSLFSFLLSNEPFGLKDFARRSISSQHFYRIHNLYDYARYTFGHRLGRESFRSHWNHIDSMIESFPVEREQDLQLLKTVGLLNVLDSGNLVASEPLLLLAASGNDGDVKASIKRLKGRTVMYHRGIAGGYCLWPHTSVNLEKAYEDASRALGPAPCRVASCIDAYLDTRPLVARRHYIETGNLRHFEVRFSSVERLSVEADFNTDKADGRIVIALCETEEDRTLAIEFVQSEALKHRPTVLAAVPGPLRALARLVQEVQRWEWVATNVPDLTTDTFAAEEVSRQLAASREALQQRIRSFVGVQQLTGASELRWFRNAQELGIANGRDLMSHLSNVCDEVYPQAPRIANELVNRRTLSSAAAAARMRLIEDIFAASTKPYVGMDPGKKPPEMSIYLSILKHGGLHKEEGGSWRLVVPDTNHDICRVRPALDHIQLMLDRSGTKRLKVSDIFLELRQRPFGIRDGLSPILLAVFAVVNEQHVAFYENGIFMREMLGLDLMRLVKVPDAFEIQYCEMGGVRSELFERLLKVLELNETVSNKVDVLDVVRPLCIFAAQLPPFTQKTKNLTRSALAVRTTLLAARDPAALLFRDLPAACGFSEFTSEKRGRSKDVDLFINALKNAIAELRVAYPALQEKMKAILIATFELDGASDFRSILSRRSRQMVFAITEPRMKAFCNRMMDTELPEPEWLESVGSLICSVPPSRWTDVDEERYSQELTQVCTRFRRVESIAFDKFQGGGAESAMRLSITQADGSETDRVIHVTQDDEIAVCDMENRLTELLNRSPRVGLAAVTRVLWKSLSQENRNE